MKIGQGSDSSHVGPVGSGKAAGSARASEKSAPAVASPAPGVPVSVSELARTLDASQNADPDINLERVAAVKDAIQKGTYTVNAEAIADRLLDSAVEAIRSDQQQGSAG